VAPLAIDLTPVLRDAYLRKVAVGAEGERVELAFHVLRRALAPKDREAERLFGVRFRGVRAAAAEAVRWDRDDAKWVAVPSDWPNAVRRGDMEPPIVGTAIVGGPDTLERLLEAAEKCFWLSGSPATLAAAPAAVAGAPVLFELTGEAILGNGWNANVRLFVAAETLEVIGPRGAMSIDDFVRIGEDWTAKWRDYWRRKEQHPELDEAQFEWTVPAEDDLR
jgi:hypothetical protein